MRDTIIFRLTPQEEDYLKEMAVWFYVNGIIPEPTGDMLGKWALVKLCQEYRWMRQSAAKMGGAAEGGAQSGS